MWTLTAQIVCGITFMIVMASLPILLFVQERDMTTKEFNVDRFGIVPWNESHCGWEEQMVHGSPQDRGSADRYYGRKYEPHWYPNGTGKGTRIPEELMSDDQIAEYKYGYQMEEDRKDWG